MEIQNFKTLPFSTKLMLFCLAIGSILLLLHYIFPKENMILIVGYIYVVTAIIINSITLVYLLIQLGLNWQEAEIRIIRILILLSNLPIAAFYFYLVLYKAQLI
jgi:membrane-bound ClpP family serine protease